MPKNYNSLDIIFQEPLSTDFVVLPTTTSLTGDGALMILGLCVGGFCTCMVCIGTTGAACTGWASFICVCDTWLGSVKQPKRN